MTLAQHYAQRWRRRSAELGGKRATGRHAAAVLSQTVVGRLLGLSRYQVARAEAAAIAKLRAHLPDQWRAYLA